ncbi:phage major capsid protein [Rhodocyclus purpureus]|uniref:phage major capsid protein n=1 Tax=Rhodocyclus purpureus TaxID=1067 RepID=UPI00191140AA|nr:phage major capsid protein [Rhodocyclus purpureus]MBK5915142.1 phage major capsid protein [Rhodocyclus purpureus]
MAIRQRPEKIGPQCRSLTLRADGGGQVDREARTLRFPFSSEEPVDMWYGTEILSHEKGAMRQGQRQATLPLLFNHCRDDLLGVVEAIELGADRRGYCTVRFGRDERGEWAMQQADDGVLVNASFMYRVFKFLEDVEEETYTATDWEPYEISLVTVPADPTVGVGRSHGGEEARVEIQVKESGRQQQPASAESQEQSMYTQRHTLQDKATDGAAGGAGGAVVIDEPQVRAQGAEAERRRINEIDAMCRAHKVPDDIRAGLIQKGASIEEARGAVLDLQLQRASAPVAKLDDGYAPDLSTKEKARYSMLRAINAVVSNSWKDAGFELEVSNDIGKRMGKNTQGFFMPTNIPFAQRAQYAAGAQATGGAMVATNLLAGSFIEVLRAKARVLQLGATVLSGLVGNVDIPRQTGATSTFWVTEGGNLTEAEATFDKVSLALKSIGTYSAITRQMLLQSTPDIEMLARADLIAQIALGIDLAALSGTGSGGQPTGVVNVAGVGSVIGGTNGAQLTIDHLIDLETAVANANADVDSMAYLTNAKAVGWLKKLKSTTGQYLWTNLPGGQRSGTPGEINGYPVARSNQARSTLTKGTSSGICSEVIFGNWSELILGEWGVLEIMPNPYDATLFKQGGVLLRAMQSVDVAVRHAASFSVMTDALTA